MIKLSMMLTYLILVCFSTAVMRSSAYSNCNRESEERIIVDSNFTGTDLDPEHKLWYFREDYGLNSFHLHWHIVHYPSFGSLSDRKDRSGELFSYFHVQILARYNAERLANNLRRVSPLILGETFDDGYFPNLNKENSGVHWADRPAGLRLNTKSRNLLFPISLDEQRDRILEAVRHGFITNADGSTTNLTETDGIDLVGRIVESSYSPNADYYGFLHIDTHAFMSIIHDQEQMYTSSLNVMGWFSVSMRDPVFYRFHKFIDDIFTEHKVMLPPYTKHDLSFDDVKVQSIKVQTPGYEDNLLITGWQQTDADLGMGLDIFNKRHVSVRFTHLQHKDFHYQIKVLNLNRAAVSATVRIFIAPKFDENQHKLTLNELRHLMIEMDKFQAELKPGDNLVSRLSSESTVTIPMNQSFAKIDKLPDKGSAESYCGCGWSHHLLVPRGTLRGMPFYLIVMLTDATVDRVAQPSAKPSVQCHGASSLCGIYGAKYPDSRPMGFPWDRRINSNRFPQISSFPENTKHVDITIQHIDKVL